MYESKRVKAISHHAAAAHFEGSRTEKNFKPERDSMPHFEDLILTQTKKKVIFCAPKNHLAFRVLRTLIYKNCIDFYNRDLSLLSKIKLYRRNRGYI